jgi:diaminopimelate epimerase
MGIAFYKMNGLGNDFVIIDARSQDVAFSAEAARRIGDRHRGVGFDQLISIEPDGAATVRAAWGTCCLPRVGGLLSRLRRRDD